MRHAGDDSVGARAAGTARIVEAATGTSGDLDYKVRTDDGDEATWPAYFTIPVGESPLRRSREHSAPAHAAG